MSEVSDMVRKNFKEADDVRDAGLVTPDTIRRWDDIVYGELPEWQSLDVYRPKEGPDILPVIVSVHGGGWVYGDKERYQYYCMSLARQGFAVVNFTYRLAPEFKFPSAIEDTNSVFAWVLDHAEEYGFDREHIFAVGDSAGAHNLGLYAVICTNPDYAKNYDFQVPEGFVPEAIALNCGVYHITMEENEKDQLTRQLMKDLLPEQGRKRELELMDVASHITSSYPPVFLMTATGDFLIEEPARMEARLKEQKVPFVSRFYGDAEHELGHVFHCNMKRKEAHKCNKDECTFFKEFL